ncbi:hypothetical protein ACFQRB_19920 [Halobaculum litoreum]|uniref:Uncharacterized protein n=1 Tax=Halobaculum litoreum TaxID=3031998 RepID=A0ABD5XSR9_9EURY
MDGADLISHHLVDAADESRSRLAYAASSTVVDESVVDAVVAAANRGVDVTVLDPPPTVRERLEHEADTAAVTTYHTDTTGAVAERLVLADDDVAVVGLTDAGPDGTDDRAVGILGTGDRNALAVQLARWVTAVAATNDV